MPAGDRTRRTPPGWVALALAVVVLGAAGCGAAGVDQTPTSPPSATPASPTPSPTLTVPTPVPSESPTGAAEGDTLRTLGFRNGPLDAFSLPRGAVFRTAVDQPNVVTLVLTWPSPTDVAGHLRRTLPAYGWKITADDRATRTFTFVGPADGPGWSGTFTATYGTSAIVLQAA